MARFDVYSNPGNRNLTVVSLIDEQVRIISALGFLFQGY